MILYCAQEPTLPLLPYNYL